MICPSCGKEIADGKKFCKYCGAKIAAAEGEIDDEDLIKEGSNTEKASAPNTIKSKLNKSP